MKPQKQIFLHSPENGIYGDCYRTCIACLLDMNVQDVPHFCDEASYEADDWKKPVQAWLSQYDLYLVLIAFEGDKDSILNVMGKLNPDIYYMLSGSSETGCNHTVICRNDTIVWDPSINNSGIIGPCDNGYHFIEFLARLT